jgi:membrane protein YdbS with pleckstrin-like domain
MADFPRAWLLRLLKVPPEPQVPSSEVRVFRAASGYLRYRQIRWALGQAGVLVGLIAGSMFLDSLMSRLKLPLVPWLAWGLEGLAWLSFLVQLPFSFFVARLDYEFRWYILSDRSLRIREGILFLREKTMTFANIQQISIRQNPLQRLLGISDVKVETAGGGSSSSSEGGGSSHGEHTHEAHFRGVTHPEEIRDLILARVRMHRDAGLGDSIVAESSEPTGTPVALEAAQELLREMRALRQAAPPRQGKTSAK